MKKLLLATVATAALSFPVFAAQTQSGDMQTPSQQQMQPANQQQGMNQSQQPTPIKASQLSKQQIQQVQINLNKQGFDTGHADGVWGHDTDVALKNFQQKQNLPGDGHLNQQTLQALGVNLTGQANAQNRQASPGQQRRGAETTGQGTQDNGSMSQHPNATSGTGSQSSGQNSSPPSQQ